MARPIKHGMHKTREYQAWADMKTRCLNPNNKRYKDYGGRGIKVCDKWMDFTGFYEDMGKRPGKGYSLDRIDNNGNYELGNCKWSSCKEQSYNRRTTKLTLDHIEQIKILAFNGVNYAEIGRMYNVAGPYIGSIIAGKYRS